MNYIYVSVLLLLLQGCGYYSWLKTGADAISFGRTGKTLTDHAISKYTGKDCRTFNILEEKQLCEEINDGD
tara:strand:- start:1025 stop:1237 length:213 start_codon:yes stop_codon:yes gene_type:complete